LTELKDGGIPIGICGLVKRDFLVDKDVDGVIDTVLRRRIVFQKGRELSRESVPGPSRSCQFSRLTIEES
jgi:hypothetical protein